VLQWLYYYNFDRPHDSLDGKTPAEALKALYPEIPSQILFLPPVVLDDRITLLVGGTEVYRYYKNLRGYLTKEISFVVRNWT